MFQAILRRLKHRSLRASDMWFYRFATRLLWILANGRVRSGPFKGLILSRGYVFGAPAAKILGTYEMELWEVLDKLCESRPGLVVNIGAGEGYYACGIAKYWDVERVIAFEALDYGRRLIYDNASRNKALGNVEIHGECTEPDLFELLANLRADLILMDIEGAELDLLSARTVPLLVDSHLLIECHDFLRDGCVEVLVDRFSKTHDIEFVITRPRACDDFPPIAPLPCATKVRLMDEGRPESMTWLVGHSRLRIAKTTSADDHRP